MHEQILKTMIMHVQEQWKGESLWEWRRMKAKSSSPPSSSPSPSPLSSSSWLHIYRYITIFAGSWKERHQSHCRIAPIGNNGRVQNPVSFLCLHFTGIYVDINHHVAAHPCWYQQTYVCVYICYTPSHEQQKMDPPLPGRPVKGKVVSICRSRHRISSTRIFIIIATGASPPSWMGTPRMQHATGNQTLSSLQW